MDTLLSPMVDQFPRDTTDSKKKDKTEIAFPKFFDSLEDFLAKFGINKKLSFELRKQDNILKIAREKKRKEQGSCYRGFQRCSLE